MKMLNTFLKEESGVGGAELALLTILGLGLIALVSNKLLSGASKTSHDAEELMRGAGDLVAKPESQGGK